MRKVFWVDQSEEEGTGGWQGMFFCYAFSRWGAEHSLHWGLTKINYLGCPWTMVKGFFCSDLHNQQPCLGHWTASWQAPQWEAFIVACDCLLMPCLFQWGMTVASWWCCCEVITAVCDKIQRKKEWLVIFDEGKAKCLLPKCIFSRYWWHLHIYQWWSENYKVH